MLHWKDLTIGAMAGIVTILGVALGGQSQAYAGSAQDDVEKGNLLMVAGGSADNRMDIVWVLHKHKPLPALAKLMGDSEEARELRKDDNLSLMMYKCEDGGKSMRLVAARILNYDEELTNLRNDKPTPLDIYNDLKAEVKKKAK
jgi:hypothetical protein